MSNSDLLDKRLKEQLKNQAAELDKLMDKDENLTSMLKGGFKTGLRKVMMLSYIIAISLAVMIFYSGYEYFVVDANDKAFWGMVLLISFQAQIATKLWIWLEMNRWSQIKEIKRLQLYLEQVIVK
ncbi:MAG: hypothetical protein ACJAVV_003015 [Alphaproteobacteria bacterium]|jgi:hypothetical protein